VGKYKVQIFDKDSNQYQPTPAGIGMHVEVKDPEQKVVLSKVRFFILYYESCQMTPILVTEIGPFSNASIFVLGQFIPKTNLKSSSNSLPNKKLVAFDNGPTPGTKSGVFRYEFIFCRISHVMNVFKDKY